MLTCQALDPRLLSTSKSKRSRTKEPALPCRRESLRARWARDDYSQLQPDAPDLIHPLVRLAVLMNASCGVRETKLQGTSSVGSLSALSFENRKEAGDST
jgi:hypothetical protein